MKCSFTFPVKYSTIASTGRQEPETKNNINKNAKFFKEDVTMKNISIHVAIAVVSLVLVVASAF